MKPLGERVTFEQLPGICICLALVLLPQISWLPLWVVGIAGFCVALRLLLALRGRDAPSRGVLFAMAVLCFALLFLRFRTFNGLAAGSALLALMAGLKLLETKTKRDIYIVALVIYFSSLAALLQSESFWLLAYLMTTGWLTTVALLRATTAPPLPVWMSSLKYGARIALQALPLALICWFLFPRFAAPLWNLPGFGGGARTGLSDSMSPGDITDLAQSDEIAFRVHFKGAAPLPRDQYWRGPVMHDFDGRTWTRRSFQASFDQPPPGRGAVYEYTINLEPHDHNWIYALDWPSKYALQGGHMSTDYTLWQPFPVDHPIDVNITSQAGPLLEDAPSELEQQRDLHVPPHSNPRTLTLARQLRSEHPDNMDLIKAVLQMFAAQDFYYTLTPPPLGADSVDDFLFNTRRGFCGHYASAFAVLMRDARIPTRVVTGYQGGTYNRFAGYWIVRQNEAHAWDEVWLAGRGWLRVDPTSAIAASRVEHSVNDEVTADEPLSDHWQRRSRWFTDARLRLDELRELWREQILTFNQDSQERLMTMLHIPQPDGQKLVLLLAGLVALVLAWLTWQVRRELNPAPKEAVLRSFAQLSAKLAAVGLPREPHEGAQDYARRVSAVRPDLAGAVTALCRDYAELRYAPPNPRVTLAAFQAAVRTFRPRARGASSR